MSDLDVDEYLADPSKKQEFVTPMFDTIAPRYDRFTRLFSLGMDARWKRFAIDTAVEEARRTGTVRHALDLASGTGDLAVGIARSLPDVRVTAIDASPQMINAFGARLRGDNADVATQVVARVGDMTRLDIPDRSVELITAGYGVRNVPDYERAIAEMARVSRPGATLVTLDFYRPVNPVWRRLLLAYLAAAGNAVGWLWYRDPVIYGYIAKSIAHFVSWQDFSVLLETHGFAVSFVRRFLGGGIAVHVAHRR
jgi:demethylmenaquinone methyltransferase/2-methoxy-6-polyprenyl-1,4-benzoquinol methylase